MRSQKLASHEPNTHINEWKKLIEGKRILVTGGCGFIGSRIVETLHERNEVTVIDNLISGQKENIQGMGIRFYEKDVRDPSLEKFFKGVNIVFHEAAHTYVDESVQRPIYNVEVNICGTVNVLEACRKMDVEKLVFASSSAVYYNPTTPRPIKESHHLNPTSPYGINKMAAERFCKIYNSLYELKTVCLRYFNVYGPRGYPYSDVVSIFINNVINRQPIIIDGDGEQTRDFIYLDDVVRANVLASQSRKAVGKALNVGTGRPISINQLAALIKSYGNAENIKLIHRQPRLGDARYNMADTSLAEETLGFRSMVPLEEGLKKCFEWYRRGRS
jgi:UDP-glucose 4-epimerase